MALVSPDESCRQQVAEALADGSWALKAYEEYATAYERLLADQVACAIIHESHEDGDGVKLFRQLQETSGGPRSVFVTSIRRISWGCDLIHAGAVYVLEKPVDPDRLAWAVSAAVNQSMERRAIESELELLNRNRAELTPSESNLLDQIIAGTYATADLAHVLELTERTVENYRHAIMKKYGCRKTIEVIGLEFRRIDLVRRLKLLTHGDSRKPDSR